MEEKELKYIIIIVSIVVSILGIIALFVLTSITNVRIPIEETYPFTYTRTHIQITRTITRKANYEVLSAIHYREGFYIEDKVIIRNLDTEGGVFTVRHYLYWGNDLFDVKDTSKYLKPMEIGIFIAEFDVGWKTDFYCEYEVFPPIIIEEITEEV